MAPEGTSEPARSFIGEGDLPRSSHTTRSKVLLVKLTCFFTGAVCGTTGRGLLAFHSEGGDIWVPAATFSGSSENLRLGVRRIDRTRCSELLVLRIPSRTPSLTALLILVGENKFFADGVPGLVGEKRFFVDGERNREGPKLKSVTCYLLTYMMNCNLPGIIDCDLSVLTLCDRAMEDFVGVRSLDPNLGNPVFFRAGVEALTVELLVSIPSREFGRVVPASSASVRLIRFTKGLSSFKGPSRDGGTTRTVDCERGRLLPVISIFDWVRFRGVGATLVVSAASTFDWVRFNGEVGAFGIDSVKSILDCVRFSLFGVFALDSAFVRSAFEDDACRALKRFGSARNAEG